MSRIINGIKYLVGAGSSPQENLSVEERQDRVNQAIIEAQKVLALRAQEERLAKLKGQIAEKDKVIGQELAKISPQNAGRGAKVTLFGQGFM